MYLTMMNSVMTWCVKYVFERPQAFNCFGVNPEHVKVAELMVHHKLCWWYSQRQRQVENL